MQIPYLNDELLKITNHTGDIEDFVEFCNQSQSGTCNDTLQGCTTGAGDSTVVQDAFATVVEQGFSQLVVLQPMGDGIHWPVV